MKLSIDVDTAESSALINSLTADLAALKDIPEFPHDELICLGNGLLAQLSVSCGSAAVLARDNRLVVQIGREFELFAAAVAALKRYFHAVLPQQL